MFRLATSSAAKDRSLSTTSAVGNAVAQAIPMQPEPVHRSRMRVGTAGNQGSNCWAISSAMGERGISTRSSTTNGKP
ncbi:hypothetical protein D3C77_637870 [compost metagenome]